MFRQTADREEYVRRTKLRIDKKGERSWTTRWPFTERQKHADFKFEPKK